MCFTRYVAARPHAHTPCLRDQFCRVQIQILLHLLLLSLPGERAAAPAPAEAESLPLPPSLSPKKPKKRKRKERERGRAEEPPPPPLEELLESYMDKMAMWQLMQSVDSSLDRGQARKSGKGKEKAQDDRDWMQAFCEDVVEPLYVSASSSAGPRGVD